MAEDSKKPGAQIVPRILPKLPLRIRLDFLQFKQSGVDTIHKSLTLRNNFPEW
jgi:hypothetical protein